MIRDIRTFIDSRIRKVSQRKFKKVYLKNLFGGKESLSGEGSSLFQTVEIRRRLPGVLVELAVRTLLDAPCGDFNWLKELQLPIEKYIGVDIVPGLIEENLRKYSNTQRSFVQLDIIRDMVPQADLILCRDCLVHLSFRHCMKVIDNFKRSGSKYLLTTTFVNRTKNDDLDRGFWRTLNLEKAPFHFPKPIEILNEKCTEYAGTYADKSLGLWILEDIHPPFFIGGKM
jgi:hypothetical protein